MASVGGDITEITYSNSDAGSGTLQVLAGETNTFDLGGIRNEVLVTGAGQQVTKKTQAPWMVEVTLDWDSNTREDLEGLNSVAASLNETEWTFTSINGVVYSGKGTIDGDLQGDLSAPTISLSVKGGGKLTKTGG
jgi:hypothetical protein